jgi:hypothetical protein
MFLTDQTSPSQFTFSKRSPLVRPDFNLHAANAAANAKFITDVTTKNTAALKAMGTVFSTGYNTTTVDSSTNPLLLV